MGVTLTLTPTLVMAKSGRTSSCRGSPRRPTRARRPASPASPWPTQEAALANGGVLILGVALLGQPMVEWVLGEKYVSLVPLLGAMAAVQALRVAKAGGAVIALARGQSGNALVANLARVVAVPVAWAALQAGEGIEAVVWIAAAAEGIGLALSLWLVRRRAGVRLRPMLLPLAATALLIWVGWLTTGSGRPAWQQAALVLPTFALQVAAMGGLREVVGDMIRWGRRTR